MPEGGRARHHRGHNDPFIAIVVSLYSHQSYRLKCFMTTPQCWNQLKTMVDTIIIDVSQLNVLYIYCSLWPSSSHFVSMITAICFFGKHCRGLFLKMTLDKRI